MRLSITRRQRTALLFLSASAYLAWFCGVGERGEAQGFATASTTGMTIYEPRLPPNVASIIVHDPFSGKPAAEAPSDADSSAQYVDAQRDATSAPAGTVASLRRASGSAAISSVATIGSKSEDDGGTTVPNIGSDPLVAANAATTTLTLALRATIVGRDPVAYVENGTMMDIVRVGDMLGDRRISSIDLRGIAFSDGSRLDLPATYHATPPPVRRPRTPRALTINDLRRLLLPPPHSDASEPRAPSPQPASTTTYPSPGPLPTVNTQGLPVGVNPTPNPNNPTPYPYPYPYAPPR